LEGSSCAPIEALSRHLPGGTEENNENLSQDSRYFGRDSSQTPPEYKSKALPLDEPVPFPAIGTFQTLLDFVTEGFHTTKTEWGGSGLKSLNADRLP
jgi:hypothetical protein